MSVRIVRDELSVFVANVKGANTRALDVAAGALKAEIQQQLSQPGRGRYYGKFKAEGTTPRSKRSNRTFNRKLRITVEALNTGAFDLADALSSHIPRVHRASAPGDPPAPDLGTLKRSAYIEVVGETKRHVGVATAYAEALEYGTTTAGRSRTTVILPRPFMRPAFARIREKLTQLITGELGNVNGGG